MRLRVKIFGNHYYLYCQISSMFDALTLYINDVHTLSMPVSGQTDKRGYGNTIPLITNMIVYTCAQPPQRQSICLGNDRFWPNDEPMLDYSAELCTTKVCAFIKGFGNASSLSLLDCNYILMHFRSQMTCMASTCLNSSKATCRH